MTQTIKDLTQELTYRAPNFDAPNPADAVGKETFSRDIREPYQRDLGRVIHSSSFRRLQTKTQVMGTGEGDFHRTRLTHSLEVGQIGRGIVWALSADENAAYHPYLPASELIEAICYCHDLGHPPFGHAGERALHAEMKEYGGFEGNAQTLRILTQLEKYYRGTGIRPTRRLLLGVLKYPVSYSEYGAKAKEAKPPKCFYDDDLKLIERLLSIFDPADVAEFRSLGADSKPKHRSFDCSIMELADDIAYGVHDLEDGIARHILKREQVEGQIKESFSAAGVTKIREVPVGDLLDKLFSDDSCERKHAISLLVGYFILNIEVVKKRVFANPYLDFRAQVPAHVRSLLDCLAKDITYKSIVRRREVQTLERKGKKIIADLFSALAEDPLHLVGRKALDPFEAGVAGTLEKADNDKLHWRELDDTSQPHVARGICDFIAGMTNPYAEKYHRRLFEPGFGSSTDEL